MTDTIDHQRRDRAALESEIRLAGSTIRGNVCNCPHPNHDDAHSSAGIYCGDDGAWRVKCHSCVFCGDLFDVRAAVAGRPVAELLSEIRAADKPKPSTNALSPPDMHTLAKRYHAAISTGQVADLADQLGVSNAALGRLRVGWCERDSAYSFPMRDHAGGIVGIRLRRGDDKWAERGGHNGLFIPVDMTGDDPLLIVEGPTDCAAALDMGFDAIGRPNNSNRTAEDLIVEYVTRHRRREVWIVTDADPAGSKAAEATAVAAQRLAARLVPIVSTVKLFKPPPPFKDLRQWRQAGAGQNDIDAIAADTPSRGPAGELHAMLSAEIDGTRRAVQWPWRLMTRGTQALIPGTVTLVVGDPGSGKSLWLLEAIAHWYDAGIQCTVFELEESRAYHLKRVLAQRVGAAWLTDLESVAARPTESIAYHAEHAAWLDGVGRAIHDAPDDPVRLSSLVSWTEARASEGARIIAIDPVTAAETTDRPWDDAQNFLQTVKPVLDRYGASLLLVTHPRKGKQRAMATTLDDLAGGAAWQRLAQCILWLERHDEPKAVTVKSFADVQPTTTTEEINRTLRLLKARNGRGTGWQLAFDFDPQTLRFHERGAIVKQRQDSAT